MEWSLVRSVRESRLIWLPHLVTAVMAWSNWTNIGKRSGVIVYKLSAAFLLIAFRHAYPHVIEFFE